MLKLSGNLIESLPSGKDNELIKLSNNPLLPNVLKSFFAYIVQSEDIPFGFYSYIIHEKNRHLINKIPPNHSYILLPNDYSYLSENDIIRVNYTKKTIKVLIRYKSQHNFILITEQCNNYCLMCSQPPKKKNDNWIIQNIKQLIRILPRDIKQLGLTGGEPTTNKSDFIDVIKLIKSYIPETSIHILSNGRSFKDLNFASEYAGINLIDSMIGIPLYSDDPTLHDYIVQSEGAFDETIQGIINLKRLQQKVEIRIVLHKISIKRLVSLCVFISRNLLFVDHVAIMALEMTGFTKANIDELWIDPFEYKDILSEAVHILSNNNIKVSIYNHQLCTVNKDVIPYYTKSISDWKNEYIDECSTCCSKSMCGGFFSSNINSIYSNHIKCIN